MHSDIEHIREIESVAQQGGGGRDPVVVASWLRCLDRHGLDPAARAEAYILPETALRHHRQRSQDLIGIARSGIDDLYKLVAGQNYVLLLADRDGVTVEYLGEETQKHELRRSGLYMGAEWSEARAGTCALGACIESGEPLIIHQSDHFDVTHCGLSCTAAPIYDTGGQLAAVLDISLLSSPVARASQYLALNLVRQTARRIEMANIMAESRSDWVLRLAGSPDFLDVDPEAALSLDQGGHVIGMTHGAARLIARTLGCDWRQGTGLIGRHVSEVFDLGLDTLEGLTRQHAARDRLITTRDGYRLFAHVIEPRPRPAPRVAPRAHIPAGLRALAGDDPAMQAVLQRAADLAPGRMALLIEGPTGCGKSTLAAAIHASGRRGPLITVACDTIAEDEAAILFGRGDPRGHSPGLIDAAQGGTLVLDNLDELPERLQARLVSLISDGSYRPLGALRERQSSARVIAILSGRAAKGERPALRPELLHRLAAGRLVLPALRQRQDRIGLAEGMVQAAFAAAGHAGKVGLDAGAVSLLAGADWPGNLHMLSAMAKRVAAEFAAEPWSGLANGVTVLDAAALASGLNGQGVDPMPAGAAKPGQACPATLRHLLDDHGGNVSAVARALGVDRSTIHRQMRRAGLTRRSGMRDAP